MIFGTILPPKLEAKIVDFFHFFVDFPKLIKKLVEVAAKSMSELPLQSLRVGLAGLRASLGGRGD